MQCVNQALTLLEPTSPKLHYLLTGTFNTIFLYLLAFNPTTSTLSITNKIKGEGPHQFLATNLERNRVYATTWSQPASLSAWEVLEEGRGGLKRINTVPITATSSYIFVSPNQSVIYSAGGPTGEVHKIDPVTGGFGKKIQEMTYMNKADLVKADKTRVALRYGSHGIDISSKKQAFVPHLGHNSIFLYNVNPDGTLQMRAKQISYGGKEGDEDGFGPDGPRHVVPSPDGNTLYAVTEHTSYVDVYTIQTGGLIHKQRLSIIPSEADSTRLSYRGDTLRLSQSNQYLYATTRGKTSSTKGYITTFKINSKDGTLIELPLNRFQTQTSGGKANAIEVYPFHHTLPLSKMEGGEGGIRDWIVLTDDELGWIWMLEWNGERMKEIASVQLGVGEDEEKDNKEGFVGASHAIWIS